jgi:hypothetical protein
MGVETQIEDISLVEFLNLKLKQLQINNVSWLSASLGLAFTWTQNESITDFRLSYFL